MGAQDKVDRFSEEVVQDDHAIENPDDGAEEDGEDEEDEEDEETFEEAQAKFREQLIASVLDGLEHTPTHVIYKLKHDVEPLVTKGYDKYSSLKEVRFPKRLRGRHVRSALLIGEANVMAVDMSRISAYSGIPEDVLDRLDEDDISHMVVVVREVVSGNFQTSANGSTT